MTPVNRLQGLEKLNATLGAVETTVARMEEWLRAAYLVTGAVYAMPELVPQVEPRARERRMACGCVPRFELVEACAAVAERIECEALGSPVAQDTARRIRLAILALREERR